MFCAKLFGDVFTNNKSWPVAKLGKISDIVRGSSPRPQGDSRLYGGPIPRLMVSDLTRDGLWVNATTDSLTEEGAKSSRAMPARSVVMAVSGTPGMTAILNHDACIHDGFVGLRDLDKNLLPEFLAYTLNLLRAKNDQQAVGAVFRNLTTDQVKAIPIPLPPIELQQQFQEFLFQVQVIQADIASSDKLLAELLNTIRINAFSGELTESWRQRNLAKISESVLVRDAELSERGTKVSVRTEVFAPPERPTDFSRPLRQWLIDELSEFQHEVWNMLRYEWRGLVIVDDPEYFDDFCTNPQTAWRIEHFKASNKRIRQTLEQLAALGLIAKVSVPKSNAVTQQTEYLTAFRPLREDENTRLLDAARLKSEFRKKRVSFLQQGRFKQRTIGRASGMKLRYLHLGNYPPIKDMAVSFASGSPLQRECAIRFVVGVNGSGKSNLLRAVAEVFLALSEQRVPQFPVSLIYELGVSGTASHRTLVLIALAIASNQPVGIVNV